MDLCNPVLLQCLIVVTLSFFMVVCLAVMTLFSPGILTSVPGGVYL